MKYTGIYKSVNLNKAFITVILCLFALMLFVSLGITGSASSDEARIWDISENDDGSVVASLSEIDGKYLLTVSGGGRMKSFYSAADVPWHSYADCIITACIEEGVENLSEYSFSDCFLLKEMRILENNVILPADKEAIPFTVNIYAHMKSTAYYYTVENYPSRFHAICSFSDSVCADCGYKCLEHVVGAPSCADSVKCEICNAEIYSQLEHDLTELIPEVSASCYSAGIAEHYECLGCGALFDINKNQTDAEGLKIEIDHDYGELREYVAPECDEKGVSEHYQCSMCRAYFDKQKQPLDDIFISELGHSGGVATCITGAVCEICDTVYTAENAENHSFGNKLKYSESSHWYECSCGAKEQISSHSTLDSVIKDATEEEYGIIESECSCGFKYTKTIPKLEKINNEKSHEDNGSYIGVLVIILSIFFICVCALVIFIVYRRKLKRN